MSEVCTAAINKTTKSDEHLKTIQELKVEIQELFKNLFCSLIHFGFNFITTDKNLASFYKLFATLKCTNLLLKTVQLFRILEAEPYTTFLNQTKITFQCLNLKLISYKIYKFQKSPVCFHSKISHWDSLFARFPPSILWLPSNPQPSDSTAISLPTRTTKPSTEASLTRN